MILLRKNISLRNPILGERAFSLMEVLVSFFILSLASFFFMYFVGNMYENMERADAKQIASKFKDGFVEKILLQIPSDAFYSNPNSTFNENSPLLTAWSNNGELISANSCSEGNCFGKVGYWVMPILHYPGLYYVNVKVSYEGKEENYTTLVRLK